MRWTVWHSLQSCSRLVAQIFLSFTDQQSSNADPSPRLSSLGKRETKTDSILIDLQRFTSSYSFQAITILIVCCLQPVGASQVEQISLAGEWRFELDRENSGIGAKWFERRLSSKISLPGSLPEQRIGDDVSVQTKWTGDIVDKSWFTSPDYAKYRASGNVKVPFWLQPARYYTGAAWYQTDINIPKNWNAKRLTLVLERPHWETRVWLDGRELGLNNSLSTPHEYELGTTVAPGKHELTIRVDNGLIVDVGVNSHSISDHTQGNWNGIVGRIALEATEPIWVEDLQAYPSVALNHVKIRGRIGSSGRLPLAPKVEVAIAPDGPKRDATPIKGWATVTLVPASNVAQSGAAIFEAELALGPDASLWDEFHPHLYQLTAAPENGTSRSVTFGLREISTKDTQFLLNHQKIFVRGTLECCIFPKTGHPPTDVASWKRIIHIAKAYGLNLIRFHSWCPPEAAFVAADELGFYYQVEIASWANQSTTLGDGKPIDRWLYEEAERILKHYGNHPSFMLMPYGNEPGGNHANEYLVQWVKHWRATDPRRLYTSGSGWPQIVENQFHVTPDPRIQHWGEGLGSRINARAPETRTDYREYIAKRAVPVISHEIGEWCVYPNFSEIPKYTGYLKPKNFEIFRDSLAAHHQSELAHKFLLASGKLQTMCYKEEIEAALRTPKMGGFELLDLHDFPGQGTALVGVLDPFWEEKGYVTAAEFHRFCGSTVPLARLSKRVFTTDETLKVDIEVAHFGATPLQQTVTYWQVADESGKALASGSLPTADIPIDNGTSLGAITVPLTHFEAPAKLRLVVRLVAAPEPNRSDRMPFENDWDLWVYPATLKVEPPSGIRIAHQLDESAVAALDLGGKVLLTTGPNKVKGDRFGSVALGFSSIFWNTAWTGRQAPHTLGILCQPKHPSLAAFPTEYHSNWQWWYLVSRAGAMILDDLPSELRPTVQVIDDWVTNRKLGLIFEAKVRAGKLLVCSVDLDKELEQNPVARQMRYSLLKYMSTDKFKPQVSLTPEQVRNLFVSE